MDDIAEPIDGYVAPGEEHVEQADRLRARLGPRHAAGGALLCRHQPLDRRRLHRRLRAQSAAATSCTIAQAIRDASRDRDAQRALRRRSPTACSAATAA